MKMFLNNDMIFLKQSIKFRKESASGSVMKWVVGTRLQTVDYSSMFVFIFIYTSNYRAVFSLTWLQKRLLFVYRRFPKAIEDNRCRKCEYFFRRVCDVSKCFINFDSGTGTILVTATNSDTSRQSGMCRPRTVDHGKCEHLGPDL